MPQHLNDEDASYQAWNTIRRHRFLFLMMLVIVLAAGVHAAAAVLETKKEARPEDPKVSSELGFIYDNGIGVPQNDKKAVEMYRNAAEHGVPFAQFSLAAMYEKGRGVPQDNVEAYKWYSLAGDFQESDRLAKQMSWLQVTEAKFLARQWKSIRTQTPARR